MKVSVKELYEALSNLPDAKTHKEPKIGRRVNYYSDNGKINPDLHIDIYFTKNINLDGWNMYMPTRHTNPAMDDQDNLPD